MGLGGTIKHGQQIVESWLRPLVGRKGWCHFREGEDKQQASSSGGLGKSN